MSKDNDPPIRTDGLTRRDFLKLFAAGSLTLTFVPFVNWGQFLPDPDNTALAKAQAVLSDGTFPNVNTFPVNSSQIITYPSTGDTTLDSEPFRKWQLIRLPADLGGDVNDVSAFRAYSMVCLHLWCLWQYKPAGQIGGNNLGQCPCHGSMYDPLTGKAVAGPASLQSPPSNVLATLNLEADYNGNLWILPAAWDVNKNGIIGYGRYLSS
ncbi:MAG TPA: Rieske 2Fe-2S domain-containing protein [Candidatus Bathyarchaeia archaeon]|nr:Rieske 2Fe-2S domain-containing protein [Candidatus Bathyarchaeia archaeon]